MEIHPRLTGNFTIGNPLIEDCVDGLRGGCLGFLDSAVCLMSFGCSCRALRIRYI